MYWLLALGILIRLAVLLTASPFNPDQHYEVIQYLVNHHALPISNELSQSYHPPLYYLLMAPLEWAWQSPAPIHAASFVFSCVNLWLIFRSLRDPQLIPDRIARLIAFAFACVLPQYVMFGSFISNDPLTILVGTILFLAAISYIREPDTKRIVLLGVIVGVGLLTKGTFILSGVAMAVLIAIVEFRRCRRHAIGMAAIFCLIWIAIGSYKYVENFIYLGHPIVHNLDLGGEVYQSQIGVWKGWQTLFDINVIKLIRRPILQVHNTFSYPLLMYGTFWYPHIPDSSYHGNIVGYAWVGSIIYAVAVVPTLIFLIGVARGLSLTIAAIRKAATERATIAAAAMLLLFSNLMVVFGAGIKYDAWSCFQSRLCFQSMAPALMLFGLGAELLPRSQWLRRTIQAICWITVVFCVVYFVVEIGLYAGLLAPGEQVQP